jgi:predicted DCC family thiol-disulfide oxidoreductase YuxK
MLGSLMTVPLVVRYDASCPFCRRCARLLREHAPPGSVRVEGVEPLDTVEAELPDGAVLRGANAVAAGLDLMGGRWRVLAFVARLPGAGLGYRLVAWARPLLSRFIADP